MPAPLGNRVPSRSRSPARRSTRRTTGRRSSRRGTPRRRGHSRSASSSHQGRGSIDAAVDPGERVGQAPLPPGRHAARARARPHRGAGASAGRPARGSPSSQPSSSAHPSEPPLHGRGQVTRCRRPSPKRQVRGLRHETRCRRHLQKDAPVTGTPPGPRTAMAPAPVESKSHCLSPRQVGRRDLPDHNFHLGSEATTGSTPLERIHAAEDRPPPDGQANGVIPLPWGSGLRT